MKFLPTYGEGWPVSCLGHVLLLLAVIPALSQVYLKEDSSENGSGREISFEVRATLQPAIRHSLHNNRMPSDDPRRPKGKSSLTFVFDVTGSMYDDLVQVREGAKRIFATVMEQREHLIDNYVLVPFHDPEVGPAVVTRDTHYFQRKLANLYVQGGGDCPEMIVTGVKMALEKSLPTSFIYVFTDARAKDYHLVEEVLNLIQEKQSQVVFVMTGDCGNRSHPGYLAFEKIASTSSGQVFHLEKQRVNEVLRFVEESVKTRKVFLVSLDRPHGGMNVISVPIDAYMKEFTVSLSGDYPEIQLIDPAGKPFDASNGLTEILSLGNVLVVSVKDPQPGVWQLRTTSRSKHTLRVTGIGAINFEFGFSARLVPVIERAHPRPLAGINTYMLVNMTGLPPGGTATELEMITYDGTVLYKQPLAMHESNLYLYYAGPAVSPAGYYFLKITGRDDKDYAYQRISATAISNQTASGPRVYTAERTIAFRNEPVNITCDVVSRAPFTLHWFKDGEVVGGPLYYKYSDQLSWSIPASDNSAVGEYTCGVSSAAGNASSTTLLEIREPPPSVSATKNVSVGVSQTAMLTCKSQTTGPVAIQWRRENAPLFRTRNVIEFPNGTLKLENVQKPDQGTYRCIVSNSAGTAQADVFLRVLDPPRVYLFPPSQYFRAKSTFNITCTVGGDPPPSVDWYHNDRKVRPSARHFITYKYDLIIRQARPEDAGKYECRAESLAGTASKSATVILSEPPTIQVVSDHEMIGRGDSVTLECKVMSGTPRPKVTWYRDGMEISSFTYVAIEGGRLSIQRAQDADAGVYTCVASNVAGKESADITVDVGSIPSILPSPDTVSVNIERDVSLQCRATGQPAPEIEWQKDGRPVQDSNHIRKGPDGSLLVMNAGLSDSGRYTCTAVNRFGRQESSTTLIITGLVSPVLGHVPADEQVVETQSLQLSCVVVLGTPQPSLRWFKDGKPIDSHDNIKVKTDGTNLVIEGARSKDEGRYTCLATNSAGNATLDVQVSVTSQPVIEVDATDYVVSDGGRLVIPCRATGRPSPTVTWMKDGRALFPSSPSYTLQPGGSLVIFKVRPADAGDYRCSATNAAGGASRDVKVVVRVHPSILPGETIYNVNEGAQVRFTCSASGDPKPDVSWVFHGKPVQANERIVFGDDQSLTIKDVNDGDQGDYTCIAKNPVGSTTRVVTLKVYIVPRISGSGEVRIITVNVNETASMGCGARAEPPPLRRWFHDGKQVYPYGSELRFAGDGSLHIQRTKLSHSGRYTCLVSNLAGNDSITYILQVREPPKIISDVPGTIDVVLGLKLEIPCRAIGTPVPTIDWMKDNLLIAGGEEYMIDPDGSIRIEKTDLSHAGRYACTAKNPAGTDTRVTQVVVQEPPRILPSTPNEAQAIENERVEIKCTASGSPTPKIEWYRRGQRITEDEVGVTVFPDGRLVLASATKQDHGPFICRAVNPAGEAEQIIALTVIVIPDIPDQEIVQEESVRQGGSFSLYCPVFSHPVPEIRWQLNSRPIVESDPNIDLSDDKRRLHVLQARVIDAGVYKCIARNAAGESTKTFKVEVLVPPNIDESKYKRKVTVILNHPVSLHCPVRGIPEPNISWMANGQLLEGSNPLRGIELSKDGRQITIPASQRDHQGSFVCVATNKAGSLDIDVELKVLAPPSPGNDTTIEVVTDQMVTMNCDIHTDMDLQSTITWLKEDQEMNAAANSNLQLAVEGHRMFLRKAKLTDSGTYTCIVRNTAGEARKNFRLNVLEPPQFKDKEYLQNIQVPEGESLAMSCHVLGTPFPEVTWERDGQPLTLTTSTGIQFIDSSQMIRIQHMYNSNNQHFTCTARNKAGTISRDFFVQIIAPPDFSGQEERLIVRANRGSIVVMDCPVSRTAQRLDIQWLKDGRVIEQNSENLQISLDRSRMHLAHILEEDEALYTCVAKNPAGEAKREFELIVNVPPEISGSLVEDVIKMEGDTMTLRCDFEALPAPKVSWLKDGRRLPDTLQVLSDNSTVYSNGVTKAMEGTFFCLVANEAGKVEKTFNVKVLQAPEIAGGGTLETREVIIESSISLECPVVGSSAAVEFEWLRDDQSIPLSDANVQILAGGRHLHIPYARRTDAGSYRCVVRNKAGSATKRYKLIVLVPPTIKGSGGEYSVVLNGTLTLSCESEGIPTPQVTWTKDGRDASNLPNVQTLSGGQQFRISQAMELHDGRYICTSKNKAGMADIGFNVDVISPPTVDASIRDTIEVILNETATFKCPVRGGAPVSNVIWLRSRRPLQSTPQKYVVSQQGKQLLLLNAQLEDEGSYTCVVKNRAGETTVDFKLEVLVPPKILILAKDIDRDVVENSTIVLSCPASGQPDPQISWAKDGMKLHEDTISDSIAGAEIVGNQLRIPRVLVKDEGRYTCTATNKAGAAEQDIAVSVMTPPVIEKLGIPSKIDAILGQRATISCPAFGRPRPEIIWLKAGRPVVFQPNTLYAAAAGQKLHFVEVDEEDLSQYTCIAKNPAGEDKRDFSLQVLIAPFIVDSNIPTNIYLTLGRSTILRCPVGGSPEPKISWLKNGQPMQESEFVRMLSEGRQLQISNARLDDSARYTCVASNPIGVIDLDVFLEVYGPPQAKGGTETIEVIESTTQTLDCRITGTAPLTVEWLKNGVTMEPEALGEFIHLSARGHKLHFLATQTTDEGRYTCVGRNKAGDAQKTYELIVLVRPSINETQSSQSHLDPNKGSTLQIVCRVSGKPPPMISWMKDDSPINVDESGGRVKFLQGNQTLYISNVEEDDEGRYQCIAGNRAGLAKRDYIVQVQGPPQIDRGTEKKEVMFGDIVVLSCHATGGDDLRISWLVDGRPVAGIELPSHVRIEEDRVDINEAQLTDSAKYTCIASNNAGEARKTYELSVIEPPQFEDVVNLTPSIVLGRPLVLDCSVIGTPEPSLNWFKDNEELKPSSETEAFVQDGHLYRIGASESRHEGRYACIAENKAGRAEKVMVVSVLPPPTIMPKRTVIEVKENDTATIDCPVDISVTDVQWSMNGIPIATSPNLQVSGNGQKLHIIRAQTRQAGTYTCVVRNEAGQADLDIKVIVLVPPRIIGDAFQNLESVVNHTIDLSCRATGIPDPSIEWLKDGLPVSISERHQLHGNGSLLRIVEAEMSDEGRYTCTASNSVGRDEADTFLNILASPKILTKESNSKVIFGQAQTIVCEVSGNPTPVVTWLKNGQPFDPPVSHSSVASHYIHVVEASREDAGRYTCMAKNTAGEARHTIQLDVLVPPTILPVDRVMSVVENMSVVAACHATGSPEPTVHWAKDGLPLDEEDEAFRVERDRLTILQARTKDAGRYTCEARNEAGIAEADFVIDVYVKPRILDGQREVNVIENERATLECEVEGKPAPTIQWMRGGRPIATANNIILSPRGRRLMLLDVKRSDAGSYSCVAKNPAGETDAEFAVTVLVAPNIAQQIDQNPQAVTGTDLTVDCPVLGVPNPMVQWLKNGAVIQETGRYQRVGDYSLRISEANAEDNGRYTCHAENEAGLLDTDFAVRVLGPPKFGTVGVQEYEVVEGGTVTLNCDVEASPKPEITWMKGDQGLYLDDNIWISGDNRQMTISDASKTDEGRYTCKATNVAGTAHINMILHVLLTPTIDKSNILGNPLAIVNRSITLECPADGLPPPEISWLREGEAIPYGDSRFSYGNGNQSLRINPILPTDAGRFTCVAANKAGKTEQDFKVEVLIPPILEKVGQVDESVRVQEALVLTCPVALGQVPGPDVSWSKNGQPLNPQALPDLRFQSEGRRMIIPKARPDDAGVYTCVAINRAGETYLNFNVQVVSPPSIDGSRNDPQPFVVEGRSKTLWCMVSGQPFPTVRWMKNGAPIPDTEMAAEYRLSERNQGLSVIDARPRHGGQYSCVAENSVGIKEMDVLLDVWTFPTANLTGPEQVQSGQPMTLVCSVTGNPSPTVQWLRNSQPVILGAGKGPRVSQDGTRLEIFSMGTDDAGIYTCIVRNEAGRADSAWDIGILVAPTLNKQNVETSPRLPSGRTVTLVCDVSGVPKPEVTWFRGEVPVEEGEKYSLTRDNYHLQIMNIDSSDNGYYKCEAVNDAGRDILEFNLTVVQAPQIAPGINAAVQVNEGDTAVINCDAHGTPMPEFAWQHKGQTLRQHDRFSVEGEVLTIEKSRRRDGGIYVCIATNEVGSIQQAYTLEVLVRPKLSDPAPEFVTVAEGKPLKLDCAHTAGYPEPAKTWDKDGLPLYPNSRTSLTEEAQINIANSELSDTGRYRCLVRNPAGKAEKIYQVQIIAPPSVGEDKLVVINVTESSPAVLDCGVQGGEGSIVWYKNDAPLIAYPNPTMKEEKGGNELIFGSARLLDGGDYKCVAQNPAGVATRRFSLNVYKPPTIADMGPEVLVTKGDRLDVPCEAVGVPAPAVRWMHNKAIVPKSLQVGNSLVIPSVSEDQAGKYTCGARNFGGTAYKDIDVIVVVSPRVEPERYNVTVKENETALLECAASGTPEPVVEWFKESDTRIQEGPKYKFKGSSLEIVQASRADDTFYRCVATNRAGLAYGHRKLSVEFPQPTKTIWVVCDPEGNPMVRPKTSYIKPRGDVPAEGEDALPWDEEFPDLPRNGTEGVLIKCIPHRAQRTGKLARHRKPSIVEFPADQEVQAGGVLELSCGAIGYPEPSITWMFAGEPFPIQPASHLGQSILRVENMSSSRAGRYECLAQNAVGATRAKANVRLLNLDLSDKFQAEQTREMDVRERKVALLTCSIPLHQYHVPLTWSHDLKQNLPQVLFHTRPLRNGSLVVMDYSASPDLRHYKCILGDDNSGDVSVYETVVFEVQPVVQVFPSTLFAQPGEDVSLHCVHTGHPLTTSVLWLQDQVPVVEGSRRGIDPDNTLKMLDTRASDSGRYRCMASNSRGHSYGDIQVVIQKAEDERAGSWTAWSEWADCSAPCGPDAVRQRIRACRVLATQHGILERPCAGPITETEPCLDNPICEGMSEVIDDSASLPIRLNVTGHLDDLPLSQTDIRAKVVPVGPNRSEIYVKVDLLPFKMTPLVRAMTSVIVSPCWALAQSPAYSGQAFTGGDQPTGAYTQSSEYTFQTGESLHVKQKSQGTDEHGFLVMEVLVDGKLPEFADQEQVVRMDPVTERYVHTGPGHVTGIGEGRLAVGANYRIPINWHHNITYPHLDDYFMPKPSQLVRIDPMEYRAGVPGALGTVDPASRTVSYQFAATSTQASDDCPPGFSKDGTNRYCSDVDECALDLATCSAGQHCENTPGSFRCTGSCPKGFYMAFNGTCTDIDECKYGLASCDSEEECVNQHGDYSCIQACDAGFKRDNDGQCYDVNECEEAHACHADQKCQNSIGSYTCSCPAGLESSGFHAPCQDVNECLHVPKLCSYGCHNLRGSYQCYCPPSYRLSSDHKSCVPVSTELPSVRMNEYGRAGSAYSQARYTLGCPRGYAWNGFACQDSTGYSVSDSSCGNKQCVYKCDRSPFGPRCSCPSGYRLQSDGASCQDIDECAETVGQCPPDKICFNQRGSVDCLRIPCPRGYRYQPNTKSCQALCTLNRDLPCPSAVTNGHHGDKIQLQMVALPRKIEPNTDILRLTAYDSQGHQLQNTNFTLHPARIRRRLGRKQRRRTRRAITAALPFAVRLEQGRGIVYTTQRLDHRQTYRLRVRAVSYTESGRPQAVDVGPSGNVRYTLPHGSNHSPQPTQKPRYQTEFWIYISVSEYPF